uniref:CHCH domain-containing protein n=1 Tax=Megaselia scalaris TaxID=36166 RepID=T1H130_MEGSC
MATGPCGVDFREAFSCFHYSTAEPKGSDCYEQFKTMQDCFAEYPAVYNKNDGDDDDSMPDLNSLDDENESQEAPKSDAVEKK